MDWSSPWITNVIVVVGFIITGWFQKRKIDALKQNVCSLESAVSAQEKIVKAMKLAAHVVDVDKWSKSVKEYGELVENIAKKQIEQTKESHTETLKSYINLIEVLNKTIIYVHPQHRRQLIDDIQHKVIKDSLLVAIEQIEGVWITPPDSGLSFALGLGKLSGGLWANQPKTTGRM
jgi:hypothetical protein